MVLLNSQANGYKVQEYVGVETVAVKDIPSCRIYSELWALGSLKAPVESAGWIALCVRYLVIRRHPSLIHSKGFAATSSAIYAT